MRISNFMEHVKWTNRYEIIVRAFGRFTGI